MHTEEQKGYKALCKKYNYWTKSIIAKAVLSAGLIQNHNRRHHMPVYSYYVKNGRKLIRGVV